MPTNNSEASRDKSSKSHGILYLDQKAVLAADALDMRRAIEVVGQAQALFALGQVREPHKMVLRPRGHREKNPAASHPDRDFRRNSPVRG